AWDPETVEGLRDATTPEALWRLEAEHGRVGFDAGHAARLDAFLRRFVTVRLERGTPGAWAYLQAPPLLWTFPYRPALPPGADVRRIVVTHVTALYDGAAYREVRAEPVRVVVLDAEPGATAAGRRP
ncbi:MAG: hypothetical protein R3362_06845, partial [Rhodothermales bacterium]|nr:hypothetical protein [Rhodothermales bacterium]